MTVDDDDFSLDALAPAPEPSDNTTRQPGPKPTSNGDDPAFREAAAIAAGWTHPELDDEPEMEMLVPDYADGAIPPSERPLRIVRFDALEEEPAPEADLLRRPDGRGLFYMGAVNSIAGDPGVGKTFAALLAVVAALAEGHHALLIDYEDTPGRLRSRLEALGLRPTELARVHGVVDPDRLFPAHIDQLTNYVEANDVAIVVIDSVTPAVESHDLDENSGGDYSRWHRLVAVPLARAGPAVILIDHRPKPPSSMRGVATRGLWAVGSRHKLAGIDGVAYVLEAKDPFSRADPGRTGRLDLIIAKDRHGAIGGRGDIVARFELTPTTEGAVEHAISLPQVEPARDSTGERLSGVEKLLARRPEFLRFVTEVYALEAKVARKRGKTINGISTKRIAGFVRGLDFSRFEGIKPQFRDPDLRDALYAWRDAGYVAHAEGPRSADLWRPGTIDPDDDHPPALFDEPPPVDDETGMDLVF